MKSYVNNPFTNPQVGDVIQVNGKVYSKNISRAPHSITTGTKYKVYNTTDFNGNPGVCIKGKYGDKVRVMASWFDLVERSEGSLHDRKLNHDRIWSCIVDDQVISGHESMEAAQEYAAKIVTKDPTIQVVISKVITVAKVKPTPVEVSFV